MIDESDELLFLPEEEQQRPPEDSAPWCVLLVDDERGVHDITQFALKGYRFENRPVVFLSAFSAAQAIEMLQEKSAEIQVILLDMVMETRQSGLQVIDFVRKKLNNIQIQIIIRTGHLGVVSEEYLVNEYEINDYREKNELTVQRLRTSLAIAFRAFRTLAELRELPAADPSPSAVIVPWGEYVANPDHEGIMGLLSLPFMPRPSGVAGPAPQVPEALLQKHQSFLASRTIAVYDHSAQRYVYQSEHLIKTLKDHSLDKKNSRSDWTAIQQMERYLSHLWAGLSAEDAYQLVVTMDYAIASEQGHTRLLERITPLYCTPEGGVLLSLHVFLEIQHLKKPDFYPLLSIRLPRLHQYFLAMENGLEEISFSQREQEVLELAAKHLHPREISQQLHISVHTVDTHLRNLRDRLGVTNTSALLSYCYEFAHFF